MWGYHLTVDCTGCNGNIKLEDGLIAFTNDVVDALGVRPFGDPLLVRFGSDPKVTGYTLVQLIETSNISGHFCDYSDEAYIDVFSCRRFAPEVVLEVIERHFAPALYTSAFNERQAPRAVSKVAPPRSVQHT